MMDPEYPFTQAELDDALLWPHTRLDSEIRSRENMLRRIRMKKEELLDAEMILREQVAILTSVAARRVLCRLGEYPRARQIKPGISDERILEALEMNDWNRSQTAHHLRVTTRYILKRIRRMEQRGVEIKESPYRTGRNLSGLEAARERKLKAVK